MITYGSVFDLKEGETTRRCIIYEPEKVITVVRDVDHVKTRALDCFMRDNPNARIGVLKHPRTGHGGGGQ